MQDRLTGNLMNVVYFVMSAITLIFPAIINGFPLVYSDTGTYIVSGYSGRVPFDRPLMYGLFVRHISLATSLWFVIVMQAILVWIVLWMLCRAFLNVQNPFKGAFLMILFLSLTTGISNYTSQIMADIFSAVMISCICILLTVQNLRTSLKILVGILIVFSIMVHSSNLLVATLIVLLIITGAVLFRKKIRMPFKRIFLILSLIATSWVLLPTVNYLSGAGFNVSRAPNIFIMGRLIESGILKKYLDKECLTHSQELCKYKDTLPKESWKFLWEKDSPLYSGGCIPSNGQGMECWGTKNKVYAPIVSAVFSEPSYCMQYILYVVQQFYTQLYHFKAEPLVPMMEHSPVMINVQWRFKADYNQYISARQATHDFTYETINSVQMVVISISTILLFVFLLIKKIRKRISVEIQGILVITLFALIFNAAVCAGFSMVADRFQGRIIWLLPFVIVLAASSIRKNGKIKEELL